MKVRAMVKEDGEAVAELERKIFTIPWTKETLLSSLDSPVNTYLLIEDAGKLIGYLAFSSIPPEGEIQRIAVRPEYRRQGAAAALMDAIVVFAREKGITEIILEVRKSNIPAQTLYKSYDFAVEASREGYYDKPKEDALLMRRKGT